MLLGCNTGINCMGGKPHDQRNLSSMSTLVLTTSFKLAMFVQQFQRTTPTAILKDTISAETAVFCKLTMVASLAEPKPCMTQLCDDKIPLPQ